MVAVFYLQIAYVFFFSFRFVGRIHIDKNDQEPVVR